MCMRELDVHGCMGTCMWRPEIDVTKRKGTTDDLGVEFSSYRQTNQVESKLQIVGSK